MTWSHKVSYSPVDIYMSYKISCVFTHTSILLLLVVVVVVVALLVLLVLLLRSRIKRNI